MAKHAQLKLEIVFFVYLWSIDVDAVKTAMSCFSLFCEEAEIRFGFDETTITQILPNHNVYMELSATSNNTLTTGRNALQKKILSLLRKIEHPTQGNKQAWYDTFVYQQTLTKLLYNYPKTASNKSSDSKNDECSQEGTPACNTPVNLLHHHHNRHSHNKRQRNGTSASGSSSSMSGSGITTSGNVTSSSVVGGSSLVMSTSNYSNLVNSYTGSLNSNVTSLNMSSSSVNTTLNSSSLSGMIYSQEHDLEDILAEWANMTGFLCALGRVWLPCKQVAGGGKQDVGIVGREASSYLLMGRANNAFMVSGTIDSWISLFTSLTCNILVNVACFDCHYHHAIYISVSIKRNFGAKLHRLKFAPNVSYAK